MKKLAISILLLSNNLFSQTTYTSVVVKDINNSGGSGISSVTKLNNKIVFSANDGVNGNEPWVSDGTLNGTYILNDINPGLSGIIPNSSGSANYKKYGSNVVFSANTPTGNSLWITDGTTSGTVLVKQFSPSSMISEMTLHNGKLYFLANDGIVGDEMWVTDGTTSGTVLIKDIYLGTNSSFPQYMCSHTDGYLYFMAADTLYNFELWKTDGTTTGTVLVKDILPGVNGSYPTNMASYNGKIYFAGYDPVNLQQLWSTDGSSSGTALLKVINASANSYPTQFDTINNKLIFLAEGTPNNSELWVTDGSSSGTILLNDIDNNSSASSYPTNFYKINNKFVFSANNGLNGKELWETDGSIGGTVLKKDINSGGDSDPGAFYYNGLDFYLSANNGTGTNELLKYNLVTNTVSLYCKINNSGSSNPSFIFELNTEFYCVAEGLSGNEIYKIVPVSTIGIKELNLLEEGSFYPNPASNVLNINNKLVGKKYEIYNTCGQKVQAGEITIELNIESLSQGVYVFIVNGSTKKFIKE